MIKVKKIVSNAVVTPSGVEVRKVVSTAVVNPVRTSTAFKKLYSTAVVEENVPNYTIEMICG